MSAPVVIIGAGPAGLAAARACLRRGIDLRLLELGPRDRDRVDPQTLVSGLGGAGLFSDGKFSFAPAGRALWSLPDRARLERAYAWVAAQLDAVGLASEPLPDAPPESPGLFKPYPSRCLDLERRMALIEALYAPLKAQTWLGAEVIGLEPRGSGVEVVARREGVTQRLLARAVVVATGRFGPLGLRRVAPWLPQRFMRLELGVRIQAPATHPFFAALLEDGQSLDPKLIYRPSPRIEWRTFCCCQAGEVVEAELEGLRAYSGRADGPRGPLSNVGFNARLLDPQVGSVDLASIGRDLFESPLAGLTPERLPLGPAARPLYEGLIWLQGRYPSLREGDVRLLGPTIEGVGAYPITGPALRSPRAPIFVAGDAWGRARGLVPALVSGAFVGLGL